jgi:hypothetical protein
MWLFFHLKSCPQWVSWARSQVFPTLGSTLGRPLFLECPHPSGLPYTFFICFFPPWVKRGCAWWPFGLTWGFYFSFLVPFKKSQGVFSCLPRTKKSYILKDVVVDEMKLSIHPSVPSSVPSSILYIKGRCGG